MLKLLNDWLSSLAKVGMFYEYCLHLKMCKVDDVIEKERCRKKNVEWMYET